MQAKLLRVLETGEVTRIGSEQAIQVDVRVLAATHRNLDQAVAEGSFREDLYYRLNVVTVDIPPLRERGNDVVLLAKTFLEMVVQDHGLARLQFSSVSTEQMQRHSWPGNIRELKNVVERSAILAEDETIEQLSGLTIKPWIPETGGEFQLSTPVMNWAQFQDAAGKAFVTHILQKTGGNVSEAARILEVERAYLHRLMRKLDVQRDVVVG
jgi:DNA-binding NtrC family response regulator